MSSEGAQLLLTLISCGDFLTVLETPRCLGLWEPDYLRKDELFSTLTSHSNDFDSGGTGLRVAGPVWSGAKQDWVRHPVNVCY